MVGEKASKGAPFRRGNRRSMWDRLARLPRRDALGPKVVILGVTIIVALAFALLQDRLDRAALALAYGLVIGSLTGIVAWQHLSRWLDRPAWNGAPTVFELADAVEAVTASGHAIVDVAAALKKDLRDNARDCVRRGPDRAMALDRAKADLVMGRLARGRFPEFVMRAPAESVLAYAEAARDVLRLLRSAEPDIAWQWYDTGDDAETPEEIVGSAAHLAYSNASALGIAAAFREPQPCAPSVAEAAARRIGREAVADGLLSRPALEWVFRRAAVPEAEEAEALTAAIRLLDHLLALRSPDAVLALRALFRPDPPL